MSVRRFMFCGGCLTILTYCWLATELHAQPPGGSIAPKPSKRPARAAPPKFDQQNIEGIFFDDVRGTLRGNLPSRRQVLAAGSGNSTSGDSGTSESEVPVWQRWLSGDSIEDLVKGSKLRLDSVVTTPAAFASGGFRDARKEFSLQALMFAIIESRDDELRWKESASLARERFTRAATNTQIGSIQVYREAKQRMLDLNDLLNGTELAGTVQGETEWSKLIDRGSLMQLLEWASDEHISRLTASPATFEENAAALRRYAELVAVLGQVAIVDGMPDAGDEDYEEFADEMAQAALQVAAAVDAANPEQARQAAGRLSQSCSRCHEIYR